MKIAYISNSFFSDCDIPLINELIKNGIEITYYLIMSDKNKCGTIINVNKVKEKYGIYQASEYDSLSYLSQFIDLSVVKIVNMSVPHNYVPQSFILSYHFKQEIVNNSFDLIHIAWPLDYPFYLLYLIKRPFILSVHDPIPHSSNNNIRERIKRNVAIKNASRYILFNNNQAPYFAKKYKIPQSKISISRLSVYIHLQKTTPIAPIYSGDYILFTGFISPYKGLKYIVEAMPQIQNTYKNIKLIIAGKGSPDFDINPYIQNESVIFINRYIRNDELASLIINSKFVCCPYIDATQSGVIMSAFALNKPVLATNAGALPEMVENGKTGLLVCPRDSNALAEASKTLLSNNTLETMSRNIKQEYTVGHKSWEYIAKDIIKTYKKTLIDFNNGN